MVERERGRRLRAEVAGDRRPGEGHHAGARQRRQLEGGEVAVAQPALAGAGQRREVEVRQQARPAVAAAQRDREVDARVRGHAQHRRQALVVRRREALPALAARRVDDDAMAHRLEPRDGAVDRRGIQREARRRVEADAVADMVGHARSAPRGEEFGQQPAALVGAHAAVTVGVMVEPRLARRGR